MCLRGLVPGLFSQSAGHRRVSLAQYEQLFPAQCICLLCHVDCHGERSNSIVISPHHRLNLGNTMMRFGSTELYFRVPLFEFQHLLLQSQRICQELFANLTHLRNHTQFASDAIQHPINGFFSQREMTGRPFVLRA